MRRDDSEQQLSRFYEAGADALSAFVDRGWEPGDVFPHRIYRVPRSGPDGLRRARRFGITCGPSDRWQLLLYARPPALHGLPRTLFLDDVIQEHQQHLGRSGLIAWANLVVDRGRVYLTRCVSDLCCRLPASNQYRTEIHRRFSGWAQILMNAVIGFAVDHGRDLVYSPTARLLVGSSGAGSDQDQAASMHLYDHAMLRAFDAERDGDWWRLPVQNNARRAVPLPRGTESIETRGKTIGICHDIERGLGHTRSDPEFAVAIDTSARAALNHMLSVEHELGVKATYNVVGSFFDEVETTIYERGHALAFHSYDHDLDTPRRPAVSDDQRGGGWRCRGRTHPPDADPGRGLVRGTHALRTRALKRFS